MTSSIVWLVDFWCHMKSPINERLWIVTVKPVMYKNVLKSKPESPFFFLFMACYSIAAVKSFQSCPTLCDPIGGSPPGSPVPGILQARTLEWVAISFSNAWNWKVKVKSLSHVQLLATPWIAAHQAPPSMGFSREEYWSGVPLPSPAIALGTVYKIKEISIID